MQSFYIPGEWNAICDQCSRKFKASKLRKRWDGLMVCEEDWESRHPQDFVRGVRDQHPLPWTRPEPVDIEPTLELNCNTLTYVYRDIGYYNDTISNLNIVKEYIAGPITIPDGLTFTVECTWEIV